MGCFTMYVCQFEMFIGGIHEHNNWEIMENQEYLL